MSVFPAKRRELREVAEVEADSPAGVGNNRAADNAAAGVALEAVQLAARLALLG